MEQVLENLSKEQLISLIRTNEVQLKENEVQLKENEVQLKENEIKINKQKLFIDKLRRMLFGSKRERFIKEIIDPDQLDISFEDIALKDTSVTDKPVKETITYDRTKRPNHHGRNKLPEDLPVKELVIEPEESTEGLVKIGEERTEILEIAPAKFFKLVLVRPKYAKADGNGVLIGNLPSRPIEKCIAGNTLLASILVNKYVDHLPLYRQQQIFKRSAITIASSTIDGWMSQLGTLLEPLYNAMVNVVKNDGYVQADETPTRVLDKDIKGACHLGYYWVYHAPLKRMVVFDYQRRRTKEAPQKILDNFQGYLQTDGYISYKDYYSKKGVIHLACWAHVRRYFDQALKLDKVRASYALEKIQLLYTIERELKDSTAEERKDQRLERSLPVINELSKWICEENKQVLPSTPIGQAFTYCINLWDSLQNYLYNGMLQIDNNLIENTIRPNALGRKNYLFAGSDEGAKRSAMFYSFMGTCKLNNINPMQWLVEVLNRIADHKVNKLHELFPHNLQIPVKQNP